MPNDPILILPNDPVASCINPPTEVIIGSILENVPIVVSMSGGSYTHTQATPANEWVIVHNLGFIPSQEKTLDSANDECFGSTRINETINGFTQQWPGGQFSGKTILS